MLPDSTPWADTHNPGGPAPTPHEDQKPARLHGSCPADIRGRIKTLFAIMAPAALRVSPRDAQMILGHAHFSTTMQIYTHVDEGARDRALTGLNDLPRKDR